jgi:hypothetical protein
MSGSTPATEGPSWVAVARSADVGAEPHRVPFGERPWILLRLEGTLVGFADRCSPGSWPGFGAEGLYGRPV